MCIATLPQSLPICNKEVYWGLWGAIAGFSCRIGLILGRTEIPDSIAQRTENPAGGR